MRSNSNVNLILKQFKSSSICLNLRMMLLQSVKWHKILFKQFVDIILSYTSLGQRAQIAQRACPRFIIRYTGKTYDKPKEEAVFHTIHTKFFYQLFELAIKPSLPFNPGILEVFQGQRFSPRYYDEHCEAQNFIVIFITGNFMTESHACTRGFSCPGQTRVHFGTINMYISSCKDI